MWSWIVYWPEQAQAWVEQGCWLQGQDGKSGGTTTVLRVCEEEQQFVFTGVTSQPVPSLLRGFSAPVKMEVKDQTDDDLIFLLAHDTGKLSAVVLWLKNR